MSGLLENSELNKSTGVGEQYVVDNNIAVPKGADPARINSGVITTSVINKLHLRKHRSCTRITAIS